MPRNHAETALHPAALLPPADMAEADRRAVAAGIVGIALMEAAGRAVAEEALDMLGARGTALLLAGPGNNGGDGFVAARYLAQKGIAVRVALLGDRAALKGDAAAAAQSYDGECGPLDEGTYFAADLVIDALFGAGLARDLDGLAARTIDRLNASGARVLAVDLPSGIDGRTGARRGAAVSAERTVTFVRLKPGHLLLPGRLHCGALALRDIGMPDAVLEGLPAMLFRNEPLLWRHAFPVPSLGGHKYDRGHALVVSGPATRTGAARLAAMGALRAGAGLVTLASPASALLVNAMHLTAIMLRRSDGAEGLAEALSDPRFRSVVLGPGLGVGAETRELVRAALASPAAVVLDADALTSFTDEPETLFEGIAGRSASTVLTPHGGEFARLFGAPEIGAGKVETARAAARRSGAILLFKGPDTVVAVPHAWASISDHGPPWLATAGSGDVLAGMIGGLLAQGMPGFEAASAAVWMHAEAARRLGPGLIAEDLAPALPPVVAALVAHVNDAARKPAR